MIVDVLIEGRTDEAVAKKLVQYCDHRLGTTYGKRGNAYLRQKALGFNEHAR